MNRFMKTRASAAFLVFVCICLLSLGSTGLVACSGAPSSEDTLTESPPQESPPQDGGAGDTTADNSCQPQAETCNGKDDDCDGEIDEGLACPKENETRPCYTGPASTQDQGPCKAGTQTFTNGAWGSCTGEIKPEEETCDGVDNDCDGSVDEDLTQACKSDCGPGQQRCKAGQWDTCDAPAPAQEVCDGKDNNCDGQTDEGCSCKPGDTQPCGEDKGECKPGTQTCKADGTWDTCTGQTKPSAESCNGKDDDCDGTVDEALQQDCYTGPAGTDGKGSCQKGKQTCQAGQWGACTGETKPSKESCDGQDNDCNGQVDDLPDLQCGQGPCATTAPACSNGSANTCTPKPGSQETCNGKDDDCDGTVDDGATCPNGGTCTNGACQGGTPPYRTGTFQSPGSYTVVGKVSVTKTSSGERFDFDATFSSSNGPDLYVYLVKVANGAASDSPKNYISLGQLKSTSGKQSYTLSQSSAGYKSIVIWCKLARRNFGYANLTP